MLNIYVFLLFFRNSISRIDFNLRIPKSLYNDICTNMYICVYISYYSQEAYLTNYIFLSIYIWIYIYIIVAEITNITNYQFTTRIETSVIYISEHDSDIDIIFSYSKTIIFGTKVVTRILNY